MCGVRTIFGVAIVKPDFSLLTKSPFAPAPRNRLAYRLKPVTVERLNFYITYIFSWNYYQKQKRNLL